MTNFNVKLKRFSSAHELEAQVASDIASQLELAIAARGQAGLLEPVSIASSTNGGSSQAIPETMSDSCARCYCATGRPPRISSD